MKIGPVDSANIPLRTTPTKSFFWADNELVDVFLPLIKADAMSVYIVLARRYYVGEALKFTTRDLARTVSISAATVSRALEILHYVGMIRVRYCGGSQPSECHFTDLKALAVRLGATPNRRGTSFSFPEDICAGLQIQISDIKSKRRGRNYVRFAEPPPEASTEATADVNAAPCVSPGNAGASPVKHQRFTWETQSAAHLLLQDTRLINFLSPTPFRQCEEETEKAVPDEVRTDADLHWARVKFNGVMSDIKNDLFARRPSLPHLVKGSDDWQAFVFDSLAVERVSRRDATLLLVLSASDPAAAQRGLEKYRRRWEARFRKWYECEVHWELQLAQRKL